MFGKNPKRKVLKCDGNVLEVQDVFATLQGEGAYAGWPAVFIRLGGCNLACNFCDTEFESFHEMQVLDIIKETIKLAIPNNIKLIVITGGEPFRQPIEKLGSLLLESGFRVQIETNGTLYRPIDEQIDVICSPKNTNGKYTPIREDMLERVSAFKFLISAHNSHYGRVAEVGQAKYEVPVYIQPMDEHDEDKNRENVDFTVKMALSSGYILSLQLHKLLGLK